MSQGQARVEAGSPAQADPALGATKGAVQFPARASTKVLGALHDNGSAP